MAIGNPAYSQVSITAQGSGTAVANTTSPTSMLPTAAVYTIPANGFAYIGQKLKITAWIQVSTTGTPTMIFSLYLAGATWCASQAITTGTGLASVTVKVEFDVTIRALGNGTSANGMFTGEVHGLTSASAVTMIPASSPAVSSGFNSTQANTLDFYLTWGAASASNTATLVQYEAAFVN